MWQNLGIIFLTSQSFRVALYRALIYLSVLSRRAQVELHPCDDRPIPGGHAGSSTGPEERHDSHLS